MATLQAVQNQCRAPLIIALVNYPSNESNGAINIARTTTMQKIQTNTLALQEILAPFNNQAARQSTKNRTKPNK